MKIQYLLLFMLVVCPIYAGNSNIDFGSVVKGDEPILFVDKYGKDEPVEINKGYLFIGSQYIPPPYKLQRVGQALIVNGIVASCLTKEIPKGRTPRTVPVVTEDPKPPENLNRFKSINDKELSNYLKKKRNYYLGKYSKEEVSRLMADIIKDLPCVKTIQEINNNYIVLKQKEYKSGFMFLINDDYISAPVVPIPDEMTPLQAGTGHTLYLETILSGGKAVILSRNNYKVFRMPILADMKEEDFISLFNELSKADNIEAKIEILDKREEFKKLSHDIKKEMLNKAFNDDNLIKRIQERKRHKPCEVIEEK